MADEDEDKSSKTEEPSERKLTKAREQGNVPKSREVNNFFVLLAILVAILTTLHFAWARLLNLFGGTFSELGFKRASNASEVGGSMVFMVQEMFIVLAPTFLLLLVFAYFGGFIQNGFVASVEPLKPKLSKISLIKGFGRLFSMRSFAEFLKSLAKMVVLGAVIYFILYIHMEEIVVLTDKTVMDTATTVEVILVRIILAVLAIAGLIAVADFLFQKAQFMKDQRMSRKELKDEYKETEGDPHVKGRQKQIRLERARTRMMQEVPNADVVVTNPTHYAVALRYDKEKEQAPRIVAMGVDNIALRIREIATENDVPLFEDPPLARRLYSDAELGEEIPLDMYEAVAKVVAFIYGLKKR
ncbi:MAG: flagellar biosynthesis protein FlhB [Magnetococcales bacterium]|nr:flagellar biosynthesis protein FlhB [Magnetococcales bacterium]MEC8067466.1 flagellar biosynthesis protein FlhB [Pseudomonadota bacterium]|tara:strand:- start:3278 stop:4348 length:1071 start_codon:yes stop_codon:yes gene_type:complete